eukprot:PLAT6783.1.p1 GENE.PLAT6783.1~~PLAT6783.1.p1  ORF type:complete len:613 (-),score=151.44 PLAT6783.1:86-1924(-)
MQRTPLLPVGAARPPAGRRERKSRSGAGRPLPPTAEGMPKQRLRGRNSDMARRSRPLVRSGSHGKGASARRSRPPATAPSAAPRKGSDGSEDASHHKRARAGKRGRGGGGGASGGPSSRDVDAEIARKLRASRVGDDEESSVGMALIDEEEEEGKSSAAFTARRLRRAASSGSEESVAEGNLQFSADFESGNMEKAVKIGANEYDIYIRSDVNNSKYRVWFYFELWNGHAGQRVLLNIVGFSKTRSMYRNGMTPVMRSSVDRSWQRLPARQVFYYRCPRHGRAYSLSFLLPVERGVCYQLAYCFPYTYTQLQKQLFLLQAGGHDFLRRETIARTLQHRRMDLLTITDPVSTRRKSIVFITSRVHPGETPAQYICDGLITFLVSSDPAAKRLRARCVFKIIPMLNPDGVFIGNYRCNYAGFDLNRHWRAPQRWCHPEIVAAKALIMACKEDRRADLDFFIDIHAHSTMYNAFFLCNGGEEAVENDRRFPALLDGISRQFSLSDTRFDTDPAKGGTGRRALGDLFAADVHCYTLEVSFFASLASGARKATPFTQATYRKLGADVCLALQDYYGLQPPPPPRPPVSAAVVSPARSAPRRRRPKGGAAAAAAAAKK